MAIYNSNFIPKSQRALNPLIYPSDTLNTPITPAKGKGMLGVTIFEPLPLPSDEQHRYMGLNSHGVSKVSVIDAAGIKQVEQ